MHITLLKIAFLDPSSIAISSDLVFVYSAAPILFLLSWSFTLQVIKPKAIKSDPSSPSSLKEFHKKIVGSRSRTVDLTTICFALAFLEFQPNLSEELSETTLALILSSMTVVISFLGILLKWF